MRVRPGPARIAPGAAPGGVVVHGYSVPGDRLIFTQAIPASWSEDEADLAARWNFEEAMADPADGVCLVGYDGDSGVRMAWTEPEPADGQPL